jgi:hypothetical protein
VIVWDWSRDLFLEIGLFWALMMTILEEFGDEERGLRIFYFNDCV